MIDFRKLAPTREDFLVITTHVIVGTLLGRAVSHLPWKDAAVWAFSSATVLGIALKFFGKFVRSKVESCLKPILGKDSDINGRLVLLSVTGMGGGLSLLTRKAAAYLIRVPSILSATTTPPFLLLASMILVHVCLRTQSST